MKYYKIINNKWTEVSYQSGLREINIYDKINGKMEFIGIGLY